MLLNNRIKNIFFVGIGGIGMSALAKILLKNGYKIFGSDQNPNNMTYLLKNKGAIIYQDHQAANITQDIDLLVYSSAIPEDNPEIQEATRKEIPAIKRSEMLAKLMENKFGIAVAGTHGKTTTTSMISYIAIEAGLDPTITVGGILKNIRSNARLGNSRYFITEADEYDRSFLKLKPNIAVITNIETDHLDCYNNLNNIKDSFIEFTANVTSDGIVICNYDNPVLLEIIPKIPRRVITYGTGEQAEYRAKNIYFSKETSKFEVYNQNHNLGEVHLNIPGNHNIHNALATIILGTELGISFKKIKQILSLFQGVERRFDIKGMINNIMIIDDYAHHPTEIEATIKSIRSGWNNRLIVVFQPHLYTRTKDFYKEFASALQKADTIIVSDVYPAREKPINGVTGELISDWLTKTGQKEVYYIKDKTTIAEHLLKIIKSGDIVITMGAGDIGGVSEQLVDKLHLTQRSKDTKVL
jgi:UDP-N-acetylmuramate--alanine ligase